MAEQLDDGESWLPSHFLTDDDILMDFVGYGESQERHGFNGYDGFGSNVSGLGSHGPNSSLSPPVESATGSTKAECDEEEYIAKLIRQMACSTLAQDCVTNTKGCFLSGSPQSTQCKVRCGGGGSGFNHQGWGHRSHNFGVSPSPKTNERNNSDAALDLLSAAAGEVARMRIRNEQQQTKLSGFFDRNRAFLCEPINKPIQISSPLHTKSNSSAASYPALYPLQFLPQACQFEKTKVGVWDSQVTQTAFAFSQQNKSIIDGVGRNSRHNPYQVLSPSAWPPLGHQSQHNRRKPPSPLPGTHNGASFLVPPAIKRESAGTGVFLPRPADSRKKPACSSVLLPAKADTAQPQYRNLSTDGALRIPMDINGCSLKRTVRIHETHLPQEWTC